MLRRLGIRGKVLAALSVPVLVLFLLAGILSLQSLEDARTARATQDMLSVIEDSRQVAVDLRAERRASIMVAQDQDVIDAAQNAGTDTSAREAKLVIDRTAVEEARATVSESVHRMWQSLNSIDVEPLGSDVAIEVQRVRDGLADLEGIRARVDSDDPPSMDVVQQAFSLSVDDVVSFPGRVGDVLGDRRLGRILNAQALVASTQDHYARELALGYEFIEATYQLPATVDIDAAMALDVSSQFAASDVEHERTTVAVEALELGEDVQMPRLGASAMVTRSYQGFRASISNVNTRLRYSQATDFEASANAEIDASNDLQAALTDAARNRASTSANAATRTAIVTIAVSLAAVIVSIITALAIARQIIRPLRRLTEAAGTVRDELPHLVEQVAIPGQGPDLRLTRIPVTSRDEIGRLAAAFNEVNQTTIEVAQEQAALRASIAEMFVNVARRDQVLLNRQLSFIDALERSEENPKILADLFRLDHLATRMRRNAESLLVLAGIDTGRRLREALPTSDVIRTASSEIEHYERIQLDLPVDPFMLGHTALPAAHMMAELLENATVFSDPGTPVHVSTGIDESAVIITIQDQGLGMLTEELTMANSKIAATSASDVLGSQRLGLYVVGRIAARLGSTVTLSKGPDDRGTLATVRMPLVLFVDPQAIPLTPPTRHEVETFVLPEEAAAVVHDTAYAPVPVGTGVQDVAAGAYGSTENPAQAVDIAAFVEGKTETGLPKRRSGGSDAPTWDLSGGDAASASAIPLAPTAESLAGAAAAVGEEAWRPPVVQTTTPLVTRTPGGTPSAATGLPARATSVAGSNLPPRTATGSQPPVPQSAVGGPTASGLPARRPSSTTGPDASDAVATASATGPANVEGRTAMFAGFRSRRAEVQAAAVQEAGAEPVVGSADAVERLAVAATGAAAFFRRDAAANDDAVAAPVAPVAPAAAPVAPAEAPLVIPSLVDDDDEYGDAAFAPTAPAQGPIGGAAPAAPVVDEPWQPTWQVPDAAPAPAPAPFQPDVAPVSSATPAAPVDDEPWQPTWETPAADTRTAATPPAPPAWMPPSAPEPVAPASAQQRASAPIPWVGPEQGAGAAPAQEAEPVAPTWAPTPPPAAQPPAAQAPVHQAPTFGAPAEPVAPLPYEPAPYRSTVDFTELVQGPTRRSMRQKKRRGLFRRGRAGQASAAGAPTTPLPMASGPVFTPPVAPTTPPVFTPAAEATPAPYTAEPGAVEPPATETPVRQSAWGVSPNGSHAVAASAPVEPPVWEPPAFGAPPTFEAPAFGAPPTFEAPAPVVPAAAEEPESGAWAPQWQASAPLAPAAPEPAAAGSGWQSVDWAGQQAPQESWPHQDVQPPAAAAPGGLPPRTPSMPAGLPPRTPVAPAAAPAAYAGPTSFTPEPMFGFDDEMTSMLAQRADIAQQALAELNQLSMYRPAVAAGGGSSLTRRTPGTIPAAPAIATSSSAPRPARDANQVRSLLSSFQPGTSRGRQLADGDDAPTSTGEKGFAGSEGGSAGHGEPVTTPDMDPTPRDATW